MYHRLIHLWTKSVGETHPMLATVFDKVGIFFCRAKEARTSESGV